MGYRIVFVESAQADLEAIHDYVRENADSDTADGYIERIERACLKLREFPNRGTPHEELRPNLRTTAFERRATIGYEVNGDIVRIIQVLHGGQDVETVFRAD